MFFVSGFLILAFVIAGLFIANQFEQTDRAEGQEPGTAAYDAAFGWLMDVGDYMGWFYVLATAFFLIFVVWLMFSRYGKVKLGPDDSTPEFGTVAWFAMLFTAGMGIGLVFWGAAEPAGYAIDEVVVGGAETEAQVARDAMDPTLFHWGFQPWSIYIVLGLALAYFSYRKGLPMRPAAAFYPLIGNRIYGTTGHVIDILAVIGTMFGLATSLGLGTMQINAGLTYLSDAIPGDNIWIQVGIITVITLIALVSVLAGIDKGVRRLSVLNLWMAAALLAFVFVAGPTLFILNGIFDWTGTYLTGLVGNTFSVVDGSLNPELSEWQSAWTFFYWGWWISWAPFVGMFIARISKGRTIRQFVVGTLFAPVGVSVVWYSTFGGSAIFYDMMSQEAGEDAVIAEGGEDNATYLLMEQLNIPHILVLAATLLTILVVAIFFITSSDSGSLVIDMLTNGGDRNPVPYQRAFWVLLEGLVTAVILVGGGFGALWILRATSVTTGLPFAVVLVFVCFGMLKALRQENLAAMQAREMGLPASIFSRYGGPPGHSGLAAEEGETVTVTQAPSEAEELTVETPENPTEEKPDRGTGGE